MLQLAQRIMARLGRNYSKESEKYQNMVKMRKGTIFNFEDQISNLNGYFEHSRISHVAIEKALDDARAQYGLMFDEKEALIFAGIMHGKMNKQL